MDHKPPDETKNFKVNDIVAVCGSGGVPDDTTGLVKKVTWTKQGNLESVKVSFATLPQTWSGDLYSATFKVGRSRSEFTSIYLYSRGRVLAENL